MSSNKSFKNKVTIKLFAYKSTFPLIFIILSDLPESTISLTLSLSLSIYIYIYEKKI